MKVHPTKVQKPTKDKLFVLQAVASNPPPEGYLQMGSTPHYLSR